jgi:voltage-gated potassium channel
MSSTDSRVQQWERRSEWPLAGAAVAFLVAYAWPVLEPGLSSGWKELFRAVVYASWLMFALDYIARLVLAENRARYAGRHIPDLLVIALPILRPLRLLRLVMLLRVLNRRATDSLRGRVITYVSGATVLIIGSAGLAIQDAERGHPGANINSYSDALWWAMTTITTVGYGDRYPVTGQGRFVAAGLMLAGIALLGIVTASLASWLIERVREAEADVQSVTQHEIADLRAEIHTLRQELRAARAAEPEPTLDESTPGR